MAGTPKGEATRRRIVGAAWTLSEKKGAEALLGGVTLRELAAAVDMAPSAITYHFPTMHDLGVAMVEVLGEDDSALPIEIIDELLSTAERDGLAVATHGAASMNWVGRTTPGQVTLEQRILRSVAVAPLDDSVRPIVNEVLGRWTASLCDIYQRTLDASGRQVVEPFELTEMTEVIESIAAGLLHRWMIDEDRIRPDLAADVIVALLTVVTTPKRSPAALAEISAGLDPDRLKSVGIESALAQRAAPLFSDGLADVTLTRIAAHLEVEIDELTLWAGTARHVAARSFARHLPVIDEALSRRPAAGPRVVVADGVYELARCAVSDPYCALALLHERQTAELDPPVAERDVRLLVPLARSFIEPVRCLAEGLSDTALVALVDLLVDTVLGHGATRPRTPPADISASALRLLPEF